VKISATFKYVYVTVVLEEIAEIQFNFNLFIKQKDQSPTYTLKYTCISNTKHNVNMQHIGPTTK